MFPTRKGSPSTTGSKKARIGGIVAALVAATTVSVGGSPVEAEDVAIDCVPAFYEVVEGQLVTLDPYNDAFTPIGADQPDYNAMGYRLSDDMLYAIRGTSLLRIDGAGTVTTLATLDIPSGAYTGDFGDDGLLHISRGGRDWYAVDVDTYTATYIREFSGFSHVADIVNVNGIFYGIGNGGYVWRYDQANLTKERTEKVIDLPGTAGAYGAAWTTAGANLYIARNSGEVYQITGYTTATPTAHLVGYAPDVKSNDGAACAYAMPPAGLNDVDGPTPESTPSTAEALAPPAEYEANYDTISASFAPLPGVEVVEEPAPTTSEESFTTEDAGLGTGPTCESWEIGDSDPREALAALTTVSAATELYSAGFTTSSLDTWRILSGSWTATDGALVQNNICGYDYTALLRDHTVTDFFWQATFRGIGGSNQGGLIFNYATPNSRAGAFLVDLTEDGNTVRWGEYDSLGHYDGLGSADVASIVPGQDFPELAPSAGVNLAVEVHGNEMVIYVNGTKLVEESSAHAGGLVGLVASLSEVSFDHVRLVALPAGWS